MAITIEGLNERVLLELPTLDAEEYRNYLVSLEPDTIVGQRVSSVECPLATWIQEQARVYLAMNVALVTVGIHWVNAYEYDDREEILRRQQIPMPDWAERFVQEVDHDILESKHVTAKQALKNLDAAVAGLSGRN